MENSNDSFFEALQGLDLPNEDELCHALTSPKRALSFTPEDEERQSTGNPSKRAKADGECDFDRRVDIFGEANQSPADFLCLGNDFPSLLEPNISSDNSDVICDVPFSDNCENLNISSLQDPNILSDNTGVICDVPFNDNCENLNISSLQDPNILSDNTGVICDVPFSGNCENLDILSLPDPNILSDNSGVICDVPSSDNCENLDISSLLDPNILSDNSGVICDVPSSDNCENLNISSLLDPNSLPTSVVCCDMPHTRPERTVASDNLCVNNSPPPAAQVPPCLPAHQQVFGRNGNDTQLSCGNGLARASPEELANSIETDLADYCDNLPSDLETYGDQKTPLEENGCLLDDTGEPADIDILLEALMDFPTANNQVGQGANSVEKEQPFTIIEKPGLRSAKFKTSETMFVINLEKQLHERLWSANLDILTSALQNVLDILNSRLNRNDLVRIYIGQQNLETPLILNLRPLREISVSNVLEMIEKVLQSKDTLSFDKTFEIHVAYIEIPRGNGKVNPPEHKRLSILATSLRGKRSVAVIKNNDSMCLARAIVVGRAKIEDSPSRFQNICKPNRGVQTREAKKLCEMAGVDPCQSAGVDDIPKFEKVIGRRICVVSAEHLNRIIYRGDQTITATENIYVYLHDHHFDTIVNVKAFFGKGCYCHSCLVPYHNVGDHVCQNMCSVCCRESCTAGREVVCRVCNRTCKSVECYDAHKKPRLDCNYNPCSSLCERKWKCGKCKLMIRKSRKENHKCGERYCCDCKMYYSGEHKCFIKPAPAPKPQCKYIFFDFETMQVDSIHEVNYCVAQRVCERCIDIEDISSACEGCGQRQFVFEGESALDEFCNWLFSDIHRGYTVIAHNARSFDAHFILNFLIQNSIQPQIVYNHTKIMKLEVPSYGILLIDSLNHLPVKLSALPKAFGIPSVRKGTFPFFFNVPENQTYVGEIPAAKFYAVDTMNSVEREEFLKWHESQKKQKVVFDFRKEIYEYTVSDVDILRLSCLRFRKLILDITQPPKSEGRTYTHGVDPFTQLTVASFCFTVFKHLFLKPNTIARVPAAGITKDKFSKISILWLEWVMHQSQRDGKPVHIQHALNGGEKRFGAYKFDGYCEESTSSANGSSAEPRKRIFSFLGCVYHGCPKCYRPETYNSLLDRSMGDLHRSTLEREEKLRAMGFEYVSKWECEFKNDMKNNPEIEKVAAKERQSRLCPRDAFMGGRTNANKLYHEVKQGEKIKYYDFCSLYPYINKCATYPVGYPEIITSNFKPAESYFGFAKVRILPPRGIEHPVLPYRANGKLTFPLCRTCCENEIYKCTHNSEERAFVGTFVTLELRHAVKRGYKVLETYEVYHFEETSTYDEESQRGGLFAPYINTFLKIKQESSGFPPWVKTEQDKNDYVKRYAEREGISLDMEKIDFNPGLRYISKLCLNNLWGKLGQRHGFRQNKFVLDLPEFYGILFDEENTVENIRIITEEIILIEYTAKEGFERPAASSNVYLAAFTTAHARLRLLSVLEMLGDRILYYDTDSIIFVSKDGQPDPPVGDFLGDLTSELEVGEFIVIFVSGGPKNYAYITNKGREVCKVRGFSLNYKNSQTINFDTVRQMVQNVHSIRCKCEPKKTTCKSCSPCMTISNNKICRSKDDITVYNREEKKDYRLCYNKRVLLEDYSTIPYGY